MSANMIGYILVGPQRLREVASFNTYELEAMRQAVERVRTNVLEFEQNPESELTEDDFPDEWHNLVEDASECEGSFAGLIPDLFRQASEPTDQDIRDELDRVADLWHSARMAPDTMTRSFNDGTDILAAGDMSYGDEPIGPGYEAMRSLDQHPLMSFLGIR
ncbi:hypothetical protein TK90_2707 (plasmid) [Thioalkalivibrio sp. K90mix]|uniref:hypothetical protein n=1 Tax=Thioalkalivibrio sp. (strain K90mix) TaxID=396595 RepID=UPI000195A4CA|nr:hypothetical protein [Thioalkalivibrio sp. K90mix]ADC73193.1 hypothetical protein TK90_2707 [Thioalkalivibrio sp. K90mix]